MYLDFFVEIPDVKGKITTKKKGSSVYVNYEIGRDYDPEKKYNVPRRKNLCQNENSLKIKKSSRLIITVGKPLTR